MELDKFTDNWDNKYPIISRMWNNNWANISTLFAYHNDQVTVKAVFLAIKQISKNGLFLSKTRTLL